MALSYPHPKPKTTLTVVDKPNGATISGIPTLATLVGNVDNWMKENGATGNSWVNIVAPGAVLVVANAELDIPYEGMARAEVLNGSINNAELSRLNDQWLLANKSMLSTHRSPKMKKMSEKDADAKFLYEKNEVLEENALPPSLGGKNNAFTDKIGKKIYINGHVDDGSILVHEYFHTFDPGDPGDVGWGFDEGCVDFFARDLSAKHGYAYLGNYGYEGGYQVVKAIIDEIGIEKICQFWFERTPGIFGPLSVISKKISEGVKPCEQANVPGDLIKSFCETAMKLQGWNKVAAKPVPIVTPPPVTKSSPTPAKKWPAVQVNVGAFRTHG